MKKIAFTCTKCGTLNIPTADDHWKSFAPCKRCGLVQSVSSRGEGKTAPALYREYSRVSGLSNTMLFEIQKRGLLPRDLSTCNDFHRAIACAINLAISSEEILRGALARRPNTRRKQLLHAITSDGQLTRWQRHILDRFTEEYRQGMCSNMPEDDHRHTVTSTPAMVRHIEGRFGLGAAISRRWIKKLRKWPTTELDAKS